MAAYRRNIPKCLTTATARTPPSQHGGRPRGKEHWLSDQQEHTGVCQLSATLAAPDSQPRALRLEAWCLLHHYPGTTAAGEPCHHAWMGD